MITVHVVGAALVEGGRVFAARRSRAMNEPLVWELPGGKVEAGEEPRAALARELCEELGIEAEIGAFLGRSEVVRGDRDLVLDVYLASRRGGEIRLVEHAEGRWLGPEDLASVIWAEADRPLLAALRRRLQAGKA